MSQSDATGTPGTTTWCTQAVGTDVAIDYWRAARRQAYVDASLAPYDPNFRGEISYASYGDFALSVKRASGEKVDRTRTLIARGDDDGEYVYALFQYRGAGIITQAGNTAEITPGRAVIYDSAQPFSLDYKESYEQVIVHLPADRAFADAGLRRTTDLLAVPIVVDGALSAVSAFFRNLAATQAADSVGASLLAPHAMTLASSLLAYAARTRSTDDSPVLLQRQRALSYMRNHLGDPELDVDRIAVGCHVSRRTLHRVFDGTGQTVMSQLRMLRVDAAQRLLASQTHLSVESIAREVGFVSDTHFYRSFRSVAGVTPGEYRQLVRQDAIDLRARAGRSG